MYRDSTIDQLTQARSHPSCDGFKVSQCLQSGHVRFSVLTHRSPSGPSTDVSPISALDTLSVCNSTYLGRALAISDSPISPLDDIPLPTVPKVVAAEISATYPSTREGLLDRLVDDQNPRSPVAICRPTDLHTSDYSPCEAPTLSRALRTRRSRDLVSLTDESFDRQQDTACLNPAQHQARQERYHSEAENYPAGRRLRSAVSSPSLRTSSHDNVSQGRLRGDRVPWTDFTNAEAALRTRDIIEILDTVLWLAKRHDGACLKDIADYAAAFHIQARCDYPYT